MTRFSADWHARRELELIESERKLVDKACGVADGTDFSRDDDYHKTAAGLAERHPFDNVIDWRGEPNMEFVNITGMGVSRIPVPESRGAGSVTRKPAEALPPSDRSAAVAPSERDVLAAVIRALALHPKVAWATRMNVGGMTLDGRHVRFGFKGCSDIIGQTSDGRFLAVECKRPGATPTDDQIAFLGRVQRAGGVAFVAWSVDDVARGLA